MPVQANIIEGSSLEQSKGKIAKTLVYLVTGISGSTTFDKEAAGLAAVPAIGAPGPAGTAVISKSAKIEGPDKVRVTVRYETGGGAELADPENPELPIYEVGTQLQQHNTPFMPDGQTPITVTYNDADYASSVTVDSSAYTLRVTRVEAGINPGQIIRALLNKVNSHEWQGGGVGTWRCINVQGSSSDGGYTWTMVYEFLYIQIDHQPVAIAVDPATGEMFPDAKLEDQNGAKKLTWYESFDFRTMSF